MARPYTTEESNTIKKEFLIEFTKRAGAVYLTCSHLGIPSTTYHYWRLHDPEFHKACAEVRESIKDKMEYSLVKDALEHGGSDRMFYMKTQMKDRGYVERVESTGRDGKDLEFMLNDSDKDLKERMKASMKAEIIAEYESSKNG